jgi:hypothetical protein
VEGISERKCKSSEDEISIVSEDEEDAVAADSGIAVCTELFFFFFFFVVVGAFAASWWKFRKGVVPGAEGDVATEQGWLLLLLLLLDFFMDVEGIECKEREQRGTVPRSETASSCRHDD